MLEKRKAHKLNDILEYMQNLYMMGGCEELYKDNGWCLYSKTDKMDLETICFIEDYPEIDDDSDEEKYPDFVLFNGLELIFREEDLQSILVAAFSKGRDVSKEELIEAISYYRENDSFL